MVRAFPVRSRWLPVGALIGALAVSACTSAGGLYGTAAPTGAPAAVASAALTAPPTAAPTTAPTAAPTAAATTAPTQAPTTAATAAASAPAATTTSGNDGYGGYGGYGGGSASPAAASAPPAASPAAGGASLGATAISGVGTVLVGPDGMTLYTYKPDGATGKSACSGGCSSAWPPLASTAAPALPAGFAGKVTLITRDDGSKQVAYDGKPLYGFVGDSAPGDATGQGSGGVWFVVTK